jgi:hypothetical protein
METWLVIALVALVVGLLAVGGYAYWRYWSQPTEFVSPFRPFSVGVADYFLTNDYWSNHYWSFDYWPAYGTAVVVTKQRRVHIYDEPLIL